MESSIGERCESLKEFYFLLQNGGLGSNSIVWDIYVEHAMLLSFIELNQLVCDFNQEFSRLNEKVIESFLMSYSIDDSIASKLENFDDWHLKLMVLYSRPSKLKNFLIRFEISSIRYAPSSRGADGFVALFRNFFTSISLIRTDDAWSESWEFDGKFRDILGNLVLLASYLELSDEDILGIGVLIYDFLKSDRLINTPLELKYIYGFIRMKGHLLGEKLFEKYFDLFIRSSELLNEEFAASLCAVSEKADWFIEFDMDRLELILTYHKELNNEKRGLFDLKVLVYISRLIKSGLTQEKLQNIILSKLIERFDWRLYYLAVFYSVIPLESDCFEKFIKFDFNNDGSRFNNFNYYKLNRFRDFRIGAIINLAYKFNIDLTNAQFDHFRGIEPYYDWLLDMENFDYSKFEPSWISEYSTIFYLRRMSKIVKLIQSILNYQDNKPNSFLRQHILTILRLHFDGK